MPIAMVAVMVMVTVIVMVMSFATPLQCDSTLRSLLVIDNDDVNDVDAADKNYSTDGNAHSIV